MFMFYICVLMPFLYLAIAEDAAKEGAGKAGDADEVGSWTLKKLFSFDICF